MTRLAWLLPLMLIGGCAAPGPADRAAPDAAAEARSTPTPAEYYRETFDFTRPPAGDVKDPFDLPAGLSGITMTVRWLWAAPISTYGAEINLENPDGDNLLKCELKQGPMPANPCVVEAPAPVAGTWDIEYEAGGPGLRAEVVVGAPSSSAGGGVLGASSV